MDNKIQLFSNNTEKLATFVTALFKKNEPPSYQSGEAA